MSNYSVMMLKIDFLISCKYSSEHNTSDELNNECISFLTISDGSYMNNDSTTDVNLSLLLRIKALLDRLKLFWGYTWEKAAD